jgi:hypothetical protein
MSSLLVLEDSLEQIPGHADVKRVASASNDVGAIDAPFQGEEFSAND